MASGYFSKKIIPERQIFCKYLNNIKLGLNTTESNYIKSDTKTVYNYYN